MKSLELHHFCNSGFALFKSIVGMYAVGHAPELDAINTAVDQGQRVRLSMIVMGPDVRVVVDALDDYECSRLIATFPMNRASPSSDRQEP